MQAERVLSPQLCAGLACVFETQGHICAGTQMFVCVSGLSTFHLDILILCK